MDICRGLGGQLQRFGWTIAEIQMEFCRFRWTAAETYTNLCRGSDGLLQKFHSFSGNSILVSPSQGTVNNGSANLTLVRDDI